MTTLSPPLMRSRPVYGILTAQPGTAHLIVADGDGACAITDMIARSGAAMLAHSTILYTPGPTGTDLSATLHVLTPAKVHRSPTFPAALPRLQKMLADAHMGLQVYVAGTEGIIGQVRQQAMLAGMPWQAVQTEHRGSTLRRVQCVHCKGITENVATDPFACGHCGLNLFVRDHYSRRLAAFQGVNIDAEDPGLVPPPVQRFA